MYSNLEKSKQIVNESLHSHCESQIESSYIFAETRKLNIYLTILSIGVGLVGNALAVMVFSKKKFRVNSSSIYLFCLAISDGLFLLIHFFEDTLRAYIDHYLNKNVAVHEACKLQYTMHLNNFKPHTIENYMLNETISSNGHMLRLLNITDRFDFFCKLINYFRYFLRFISAYIIVAFTVNRCIGLYFPDWKQRLETKKLSKLIIFIIFLISLVANTWVPYMFR